MVNVNLLQKQRIKVSLCFIWLTSWLTKTRPWQCWLQTLASGSILNMLLYYLRMFVQNVCCILSRMFVQNVCCILSRMFVHNFWCHISGILSQNVCSKFLVVFYPEFYFRMLSFCSELFCLYSEFLFPEFLSQNICLSQNVNLSQTVCIKK